MQKIQKFIVIAGNGTVSKAVMSKIMQDPKNQVLVTTHGLSDTYQSVAQKKPHKLSYAPTFNPLSHESLLSFRKTVEDFADGERYAVIMPIGYFVAHKPFVYHTLKENQDILNVNYIMPANIMQTLIPHMLQNNGGHFVSFSCQSTQRHDPFMGAFTAAKSALESLIQTNANEYGGAENNILFNAVRVASVKTDLTVSLKPNGDIDGYIHPEDIADITLEIVHSKQADKRNGSIENAFKYSKTFFLDGSMQRISADNNHDAIQEWGKGSLAKKRYPRL